MILPQQTNCRSCCRSLQQLNLFLPLSQKNLLTYLGSCIQQLLLQSTATSRELSFVASVLLRILVHAAAPTLLFKLSTVNHLISCCTYFLKKAEVEKSKRTTCSGPTKLPKQHNSVDAQTWQALHSSVWIKSNQLFSLLPHLPIPYSQWRVCLCCGGVNFVSKFKVLPNHYRNTAPQSSHYVQHMQKVLSTTGVLPQMQYP